MARLDEIFDQNRETEEPSQVLELLTDIKNRLQSSADYQSLAKRMGITQSELLRPKAFSLDLTKEHEDKAFNLIGSKIVISHISGNATLKFDKNDKGFPLRNILEIPNPNGFRTFYLSNQAQKKGATVVGLVTTVGGPRNTPTPEKPGKPYGDVTRRSGEDINLPAGEVTDITDWEGYGWFHSGFWVVDNPSIELVIERDSPGIFYFISPDDLLKNWGHSNQDSALECTRYDDRKSEYVINFDPATNVYYDGNIIVKMNNPDGVDHTLLYFETRALNNTRQ